MSSEEEDDAVPRAAYRAPAAETPVRQEELYQRGRMWIALLMAGFGLSTAVNLVVNVVNTVAYRLAYRIEYAFQQAAGTLLLLLVHRGRNWARLLLIVWLALAMVGLAWMEHRHPQLELRSVIRKGLGVCTLGMLLFSPSIRALVTASPRRLED